MLDLIVLLGIVALFQSLIFFMYKFVTNEWVSLSLVLHLIAVNIITIIVGYYAGLNMLSLTFVPMAEIQTIFTIHGGVLMLSMFAFLFTSEIRK